MNLVALLWFCLNFNCHGRREQAAIERLQIDSSTDRLKALFNPSQFLTVKPSAAFNGFSPKIQPPLSGPAAAPLRPAVFSRKNPLEHVMSMGDESKNQILEIDPLMKEKLDLERSVFGPEHPNVITALSHYVTELSKVGRHPEAEPLMNEALEISENIHGFDHSETLKHLTTYANLLIKVNREDDAEQMMKDSLELRRHALGPEHPDTLANSVTYGRMLCRLKRVAEGESFIKDALAVRRRTLGPQHPDTLATVNIYASALIRLGREAEAEPMMKETLALVRRRFGPHHMETYMAFNRYAVTLALLGAKAESQPHKPLYQQIQKLTYQVLGRRIGNKENALRRYAVTIIDLCNEADAEPLMEEVLELARDMVGEQKERPFLLALNAYFVTLKLVGSLSRKS
mmetsp:Transcript_113026/g.200344  ORF Transcript_113026/g.200344 Transcript_113026/m.200344 type:complete len:401 (-) Transcript_113026:51-1253(-)